MLQVIQLSFTQRQDAPKALADSLSFFGSLRANREVWASLLRHLGWKPRHMYYMRPLVDLGDGNEGQRVAVDIVTRCCPVEGDPHPQRATAECGEYACRFVTPGGVEVFLQVVEDKEEPILLTIDFHRPSRFAATCVAARLFESLGDPKEGTDLGPLVADALSEIDEDAAEEAAMSTDPDES